MKTVEQWEEYLTELAANENEPYNNKMWMEGFVCGLTNAGVISEADEDRLMEFIHEM